MHGNRIHFPWRLAALNYSLLFGFLNPSAYLTTGAWSIGNEMVFYSIFPLLLYFSKKVVDFSARVRFQCGRRIVFCFLCSFTDAPIEAQWNNYINPFNQLFLFLSGVAIGLYFRPSALQTKRILFATAGVVCAMVFGLVPASGNEIEIATGTRRLLLSSAAVIFVACVFVSNFSVKGMAGRILGFLGEGCYSIYLLHPLVVVPFVFVFSKYHARTSYGYAFAFVTTLVLSRITYRYLEHPMIVIGGRISRNVRSHDVVRT